MKKTVSPARDGTMFANQGQIPEWVQTDVSETGSNGGTRTLKAKNPNLCLFQKKLPASSNGLLMD